MPSSSTSSNEKTPLVTASDLPAVAATPVVAARVAYELADVEQSRQYHDSRKTTTLNNNDDGGTNVMQASEQGHQMEGEKLKPIIFGGLDGILTSFAIVAGAAGGQLDPSVVLILGFSNIFADALSMGVGEFLSSKAEAEWILSERDREEWELENYPQGEIEEMIDIYKEKGMSHEDAVLVITTMAKYKDLFVDVMMTQELQLLVPETDHIKQSAHEGFVMFCSFAFFGALPLIGYVIIPIMFPELGPDILFTSACVVTGIVLFLMGSVKSYFSKHHWFHTGMETLLLGGTCAFVAFSIGQFVKEITGSSA